MRHLLFTLLALAAGQPGKAEPPAMQPSTDSVPQQCSQIRIEAERLPSLNIPRSAHFTYFVNGEVVVMGGHTSGFVPTPTAEYLRDGRWHTLDMVYDHDHAVSLPLRSGKILIGGGSEQPLGIGQTFSVEIYDPETHEFEGFGCLDTKRVMATAIEMEDSTIMITGNWYHRDNLECFNLGGTSDSVGEVSAFRALPYIFRTAADNFMFFGPTDYKGKPIGTMVVDQLKGEPFVPGIFDTWHCYTHYHPNYHGFIGDTEAGIYSYIFPARNDSGQVALIRTMGTDFSLLTTESPIPMCLYPGDSIRYVDFVLIDTNLSRGYLCGVDKKNRMYFVAVDYNADTDNGCPITLYHTDPLDSISPLNGLWPVLDADGNIVMAGGIINSNFYPLSTAYLFRIHDTVGPADVNSSTTWIWILCLLALISTLAVVAFYHMRRNQTTPHDNIDNLDKLETLETLETLKQPSTHPKSEKPEPAEPKSPNIELMERIVHLVEDDRLYLNNELMIQDIATLTDTNSRYVSACINELQHCSFSLFINRYRVEHAQIIMRSRPDAKMLTIAVESGFANDTTFFRVFKQVTGMTPRQWIAKTTGQA